MNPLANQTVVVPFDFSKSSQAALDQVIEWAEPTTRIHLIHVVEPCISFVSMDPTIQLPPSYEIESRDQAKVQLENEFCNAPYDEVVRHCVIGDPGSEIVKLAKKAEAGLIVMPSHGRTGIARLLLGSVAERVLRLANCPVLILRGKAIESNVDRESEAAETC